MWELNESRPPPDMELVADFGAQVDITGGAIISKIRLIKEQLLHTRVNLNCTNKTKGLGIGGVFRHDLGEFGGDRCRDHCQKQGVCGPEESLPDEQNNTDRAGMLAKGVSGNWEIPATGGMPGCGHGQE